MPRGNPDKLKPVRSKREASERGKKGGVASGVARREKAAQKIRLKEIAEHDFNKDKLPQSMKDIGGVADQKTVIDLRLVELAQKGNIRAMELFYRLYGDDPTIKLKEREVALKEKESGQPVFEPDESKKETYISAKMLLWEYCKLKAPDFYREDARYLKEICRALQDFEDDDNELLVLNLPPRHGKTRTVGLAAQWYLGRNPRLKMIVASYNEKLSRQISKTVRDDIGEVKADENRAVFTDVFRGVKLQQGSATADLWRLEGCPTNNYLATSPKSSLTGFGAEIVCVDDIIRDAYTANHKQLLEEHFQWFTDTLYSRLEGRAKLIIIMTRWATKDLAGRVISMYQEQKRKIRIISKKAFDGTNMLNERILNRARYDNLIQTVGEDIVRANYDQEPIDLRGRLYGEFIAYADKPEFTGVYAICDTADEGTDFLCLIIYGLTHAKEPKAYVIDVYYTQDPMEVTEREIARRLIEFNVEKIVFESNFGGKAFAKVVQRLYKEAGGNKATFHSFQQTKNKEARILSNATNVTRCVYMPEHWNKLYPKFYQDVTEFQRTGGNISKDGPDTLTMVVERRGKTKFITI